MLSIITKIFICLYWVVLISHNIYNFCKMPEKTKKRNYWIKALIIVNFVVILLTFVGIFK